MRHRMLFFVALVLVLSPSWAQQPAPPAFDAEAVVDEVNSFYAAYWNAWNQASLAEVDHSLAPEFEAFSYGASGRILRADRKTALDGIGQFFSLLKERQILWGRSLLSVVPQSATQAIAATRSDFSLMDAPAEVELTLDVLRKGEDGRWRLARRWSEKAGR